MRITKSSHSFALALTVLLWGVNLFWLARDTRPPVWDMALHQTYALNYIQDGDSSSRGFLPPWERSGNYPPFVHLSIACCYLLFHPGPHIAVLANVPATFILLWSVYQLASELAGTAAARWACVLTALTPYLIWLSRETILDYWLSAFVALSLLVLRRTRGFEFRRASLLLGVILACGLLTKWLFIAFLFLPLLYVCIEYKVWKHPARLMHLADSMLVAGSISGLWYLPNVPKLVRYFFENAGFGAAEGEPPVFSFESAIYYLRLLEGYQLFALLFAVLCFACYFVWKESLLRNGGFLLVAVAGGWLAMTLLRTKDPRFTMPLLGPLAIVSGAWIQSWGRGFLQWSCKTILVVLLCAQAYAANFGISWLPQRIILAQGYQGSLRWDWNLYLQDYFGILGRPRREDWKQTEILQRIAADAALSKAPASLALVPDLPRFNSSNFALHARLLGMRARIEHLTSASNGIRSFDGFNYVLMTEGEQGMPWTTGASRALNQIIVDEHQVFRMLELYSLPNGDSMRLYSIQR